MNTIIKKYLKNNLKSILLERENIYKGNLLLVNRQNPLQDVQLGRNALMVPSDDRFPDILLRKPVSNMLKQLLKACSAGDSIVPVSGYRSLMEQQQIFMDSIKEKGEEFTLKYVALPNHSEHQTGLAIDMAQNLKVIDFICPDFPYEGICQTFRDKASKYGFIERYQKGKEQITGISHEPWHFRYVGYPHSEIMKNNDFTLEEYTEYLKYFTYDDKHLKFENQEQSIEIFYVEASETATEILVDEYEPYQISGNNMDGFVVTIWRDIL
ncbi:MAG: peptidase [Eubacterium sp.]|nr:peptidase [Eubacterium sp.]